MLQRAFVVYQCPARALCRAADTASQREASPSRHHQTPQDRPTATTDVEAGQHRHPATTHDALVRQ